MTVQNGELQNMQELERKVKKTLPRFVFEGYAEYRGLEGYAEYDGWGFTGVKDGSPKWAYDEYSEWLEYERLCKEAGRK